MQQNKQKVKTEIIIIKKKFCAGAAVLKINNITMTADGSHTTLLLTLNIVYRKLSRLIKACC